MHSFVTPTPKKPRTAEKGYNRKKKSLGLLAETFLNRFVNAEPGEEVFIDQLAQQLAVERRRIYDVVNILESLRIVVKKGKNAYHWMGTDHLDRMFAILQHDAIFDYADDAFEYGIIKEKPSEEEIHAAKANQDGKETKSLSRLSQMFLRCYLVGHTTLSLPEASDKITGETTSMEDLALLGCKNRSEIPTDPKLFQQAAMRGLKTKIRRLYDISNVFLSMGLLAKQEDRSTPMEAIRPRFSWNYKLSPKEIYEVYQQMPEKLKKERNPFQCEVALSKGEKTPVRSELDSKPDYCVSTIETPSMLPPASNLSVPGTEEKVLSNNRLQPSGSPNQEGDHNPDNFSGWKNINLTGGAVEASVIKNPMRRISLPDDSALV